MDEAFRMVSEFHRAYGVAAPAEPRLLDPATQELRLDLIREELEEYRAAAAAGDVVAVADALADLAYVAIGAAVAHGLTQFPAIFAEVHRSNMSKLGLGGEVLRRPDGKILKGPNYAPPNLARFLQPDRP
jgi:predicted HAD superfamily Cof-like phosphohydrolase